MSTPRFSQTVAGLVGVAALLAFAALVVAGPTGRDIALTSVASTPVTTSPYDPGRPSVAPDYPDCQNMTPGQLPVTCRGALRLYTIVRGPVLVGNGFGVSIRSVKSEPVGTRGMSIIRVTGYGSTLGGAAPRLSRRSLYLAFQSPKRRYYAYRFDTALRASQSASQFAADFQVPTSMLRNAARLGETMRLTVSLTRQSPERSPNVAVLLLPAPLAN